MTGKLENRMNAWPEQNDWLAAEQNDLMPETERYELLAAEYNEWLSETEWSAVFRIEWSAGCNRMISRLEQNSMIG